MQAVPSSTPAYAAAFRRFASVGSFGFRAIWERAYHRGRFAKNLAARTLRVTQLHMKPLSVLGLLACAAAMGAQLVGRGVVLPELAAQTDLIDANLIASLSEPVHLRLSELVLAAHLLIAASANRWLESRWATSVALVLVGLSALQRFVVLPTMYGAWSMADLVAARPIEHVLVGERMQWQDNMLVALMTLGQLALVVAAARMMRPVSRTADVPVESSAPQAAAVPA